MPTPKPRMVGNPNNQKVRGFRYVSAEAMRASHLSQRSPAGAADRVVSYDPGAVRAAIEAQMCPFCGKGPYKMIAGHTRKAHGVGGRELREMAGLKWVDPICSPELSQAHSELARGRDMSKLAGKSRGPRQVSAAGRASLAAAARAASQERKEARMEETMQRFAELGGGLESVEQLAAEQGVTRKRVRMRLLEYGCTIPDARALAGRRRRRVSDEDRREIARLYGMGLSQSQIAKRYGIGQSVVSEELRRAGVQARPFRRSSWLSTNGTSVHRIGAAS